MILVHKQLRKEKINKNPKNGSQIVHQAIESINQLMQSSLEKKKENDLEMKEKLMKTAEQHLKVAQVWHRECVGCEN